MTLDDKRIYLVWVKMYSREFLLDLIKLFSRGGYDILQNMTTFLTDYTIYNMSTGQYDLILYIRNDSFV